MVTLSFRPGEQSVLVSAYRAPKPELMMLWIASSAEGIGGTDQHPIQQQLRSGSGISTEDLPAQEYQGKTLRWRLRKPYGGEVTLSG